jgi:hypothetical protein
LLCRYGTGFQIRYGFSLFYSDAMASPAHSNKRILSFSSAFRVTSEESQSPEVHTIHIHKQSATPLFHFVSSHLTLSFFFFFFFCLLAFSLAEQARVTARTLHSGVSNSPPGPNSPSQCAKGALPTDQIIKLVFRPFFSPGLPANWN